MESPPATIPSPNPPPVRFCIALVKKEINMTTSIKLKNPPPKNIGIPNPYPNVGARKNPDVLNGAPTEVTPALVATLGAEYDENEDPDDPSDLEGAL